ncbi:MULTISPECIES: DUF1488 family protein [Vibrio]|uniref:DUF1488 domain-containing protein n=1 Tax=Vibrio casei TaxID=673372 RepID=A0A368LK78_9VIBR|nr:MULTISPECIES: DUF1488 domain-containing protein [Vibrio]RCS72231.1 DUF1488 domain-containing protein [Vibrio casei]SJN22046.1 FIG034389 (not subsystem-based): hypothetical protein [Vibrio casei]HBV76460.1 DUF1488 domain-containing protein [Vibrio sp.]
MNQNILFPDIQTWVEERNVIIFPAQQAGKLIECVVSLGKLSEMAGYQIQENEILVEFDALRFDLEELAEKAIENEDFNLVGEVELG